MGIINYKMKFIVAVALFLGSSVTYRVK